MHLTAGCAVVATGSARAVAGQGPAVRDAGERDRGGRLGRGSGNLPDPAKRHTFEYLREVAHLRPRTNVFGAVTRVRHTIAQAIHRFFHEHGFFWVHTPIITASDAEGRGRDVPRLDARPGEPAAHAARQGRLRAGFLRPRGVPHRVGPAQRRDLLPGAEQGLHVRADVPRRELATPAGTWPSSG